MSAWLHNVPELSSSRFIVCRPSEARHLSWCDVATFDGSVNTLRKTMASSTSEIPKRAESQVVQLSNTCSTLRLFPATTPTALACHINITRTTASKGGGATDHWLQYRDFPQLRLGCRWISERNLKRYVERRNVSKTGSPKKLQTVSALSQSSRLVSLQNKTTESPATNPLQPPRCNEQGRGAYSVLRSGVEQRSFAHAVSPFGTLPFTT